MNIFQKIKKTAVDSWQFVDGHKMEIGGSMMFLAVKIPLLFPQAQPICDSVFKVGQWILEGGGLHKLLKYIPNQKLPPLLQTRLDPNGKPA